MKQLSLFLMLALLSACAADMNMMQHSAPTAPTESDTPGSIAVMARATEWRKSGVVLRRGERYEIEATGQWSAAPTCTTTGPGGDGMYGLLCPAWPLGRIIQGVPHQRLIGKIGDNGAPFPIGASYRFTASADGTLYLRLNEDFSAAWDNGGHVNVAVYGDGGVRLTGAQQMAAGDPKAALERFPHWDAASMGPETGIYAIESARAFNVLDKVVFDPRDGRVTLIGHTDRRFGDLRIPYFQHLAALLESPAPAFSLNWTAQSEAQIDAVFRRLDSAEETRRLAARWGEWIDAGGRVTPMGRHFMPLFGVKPSNDRYQIIASILRVIGNDTGADIVEKTGVANAVLNTPAQNAALLDLINVAVPPARMAEVRAMSHLSEDRRGFLLMQAMCSNLDRVYGLRSSPVRGAFDRAINQGQDSGTAMTRALAELDRQLKTVLYDGMQALLHRHDRIRVPPEVMQATLGARPEVVPDYIGVDPTSQLARVLYEADYLGKQIPNRDDLEDRIPGFLTEFSFSQRHGGTTGNTRTQRLWISVGDTDLAQSRDGRTLEIRNVRMRFNMREMRQGRDVAQSSSPYADLLTTNYNALAIEFPVLHELREVAKLRAAARWIEKRRPGFHLPDHGRSRWQGPRSVPGLVYFVWTTRPQPGRAVASMMAMGGISLDFLSDTSVVDLRPDPLSVPPVGELRVVGDILDVPADTDLPEPLGWVQTDVVNGKEMTALSIRAPRPEEGAGMTRLAGDPETGELALWKAGDLDRAYNRLQAKEAGLGQDPAALAASMAMRAEILHEQGNDAAAVALLERARRIDPGNSVFGILLAKEKADSGDRAGAIADVEHILAEQPDNQALARVLADLKRENSGGRLSTLPKGASRHTLDDYGLAPTFEGQYGQVREVVRGGFKPKGMEKIEPVPAYVPADVAADSNFAQASKTAGYREIQGELGDLVKEEEEFAAQLRDIRSSDTAATPEQQATVEQMEQAKAEATLKVVEAKKRLRSFVVNFAKKTPDKPSDGPDQTPGGEGL